MIFAKRISVAVALLFAFSTTASADEPGWHIYTDTAHGFSISYPDGWTANPNYTDKGYAFIQGDTDDVRTGLGLSPVVDIAPGTTLESGSPVLAVQFARPGDTCRARAFLADPSPDYVTQVDQDTPDAAHAIAEPGDLYSVEHMVRIVSHTPCIAVQIYLVYARPRPHDTKPAPPFDRAAVFALLSRIVGTLKPLK
jgi:hypothetical protein